MSNVGRNAPCPCGSGKKYKKCCIDKYDTFLDAQTDQEPNAAPTDDACEFDPYPYKADDTKDWETSESEPVAESESDPQDLAEAEKEEWNAFPGYPNPPEKPLPALPPEQNRLVDDWWKAVKPAFMKRDADAMFRHLTSFWDLHPELVPHLELEMDFLFELGAELGRRKEWSRYADVLLRLREEHPVAYFGSFGFFDYDLIIEALVQGRTRDIPRFFDLFHRYPGSDLDNSDRILHLLAWAGAEEALLEFAKPLRKTPHTSGVSLAVNWLLFALHIPHLASGADPDEAADSVEKELKKLNLAQAPDLNAERLRKAFECARQAPALPDYDRCQTHAEVEFFFDDVMWNFTGFLHKSKGLPWTRSFYLAGRLRHYWGRRAEDARPRTPFSLDLQKFEAFLCRTCQTFFHYDGVLTASLIEAMGHFADYLLACGALGEQKHLDLQDGCRTLYRQALTSYDSTDPVPRLMPELLLQDLQEETKNMEYDLVVYGQTSAGVMAAVQARRLGKTVILVGPDKHLGGLSSGGLGSTDIGNKAAIGGLSREFYGRLGKHYGKPEMWTFEPHVAEQVFENFIAENNITVHRDEWLDRTPGKGVKLENGRITSITMLSGKTYRGKMFIDATYEGDLMAAAGVSYTFGREANSEYGETLSGVATKYAIHHQFSKPIDPYVKPGDPSSGLLPGVTAGGPGQEGTADKRIQAYCFRMCLTDVAANRLPFPKPEGYDPLRYELLLRTILAEANPYGDLYFMESRMPNGKTDSNNKGPFSTDNIGMNYDYPEGDYATREQIIQEHETYQKGFVWFLANDPRVPERLRERVGQWGLPKDEFKDNGHWSHQLYIREARRMVGAYVMTQLNCQGTTPVDHSIGMGAYTMDSHHTQRYVDEHGHARNEGDVEIGGFGPYPIAYGAIVPKQGECANLLVPVCLSATHMAFGSIRMEPVFMVLGQSAATAAAQAIDANVAVQDIDYAQLRARLLADNQVLEVSPPQAG